MPEVKALQLPVAWHKQLVALVCQAMKEGAEDTILMGAATRYAEAWAN